RPDTAHPSLFGIGRPWAISSLRASAPAGQPENPGMKIQALRLGSGCRAARLARAARNDGGYFTAWMRLTMSAYLGPYLSQTGFTASWNAFLSAAETLVIVMPAAAALSIACFS